MRPTGTVYYTFDEIAFGNADTTAATVYTNIVVTSNVPEPSSLVLLLLAAAGVACRVGRRPRP